MAKSKQTSESGHDDSDHLPLPADFESAFAELETLLNNMESGELSLAQSLTAYKRGDVLLGYCQKTLSHAEQEIQLLNEKQMLETFKPEA